MLIIVIVILAMSQFACVKSEEVKDNLTVEAVVETQTEKLETGPDCEYTFISQDVQHRLNHYKVCYDANDDNRIEALNEAIEDCESLCDETFDAESDCDACVSQCNAE